ncbi:MAG: hypothetical protein V9G10_17925 [Candidatus Nanopelagicales bacterium]
MTTDTVIKTSAVREGYAIGGMAKGAGMLAPGHGHHAVRHHHRRRD